MKKSAHTKKLIQHLWILRVMDWLCLGAPVIIYCFYALFSGQTLVLGKLSIAFSFVVVIIMTFLNAVAKLKLRSPVWIFILGLYIAMKEKLLPLIIILAVTSIIDDFILAPAVKKLEMRVQSSISIDERMGENVRDEL